MLDGRLSRLGVCSALLVIAACGGDGGGGTNPPPVVTTLSTVVATPTAFSVAAGQQQTITAQGQSSSGAVVSGVTFTFSSSNSSVASVSAAGAVIGLSTGSATITVTGTAGGVSASTTVAATVSGSLPNAVVVAAGANSNDFTPRNVAVARGGTVTWTFGATLHDVDFQGQAGAPPNIPITANSAGIARTFTNAGNFGYLCTLHSGMSGSVLVP